MKKILLILLLFLFANNAHAAQPLTRIVIEPLDDAVSFSTVYVGTTFHTMPTVELVNRKEINIFNVSANETDIVFLGIGTTANTAITVTRWLLPRQDITFKVSSDIHIYASADTTVLVQITEVR